MKSIFNPRDRSRFGARPFRLAACLLPLCFESMGSELTAIDLQAIVERQAGAKQVCAVSYATIHAGKISSSGGASGCHHTRVPTADSVFQAASLS